MSTEHVNFIPDYVDQKDPDVQWDIGRRAEYTTLISKEKTVINREHKSFFNHQDLVKRFMRVYDKALVIHETGTGKAGTIINIVDGMIQDGIDKKAYVFQPGPQTKEDFKKQILKLSSFAEEKFDTNMQSENINVRKYHIANNIRKYYNIETYNIFTTAIEKKNLSEEQIIEEFSDCYFFLDEIHRLRNQDQSDSGLDGDPENIYNTLWKIFHLAKRIKVVLLTATPMINSTDDFVPLLNLILPADKQLPSTWNYDYVNIRQLEYYMRGYISYIKNMDLGVQRVTRGEKINFIHTIKHSNDKTTIEPTIKEVKNNKIITVKDDMKQPVTRLFEEKIPSSIEITQLEMIGLQRDTYIECVKRVKTRNFRVDETQISIAIFPDGSYGNAGFAKNIRFNYDTYEFTPYFYSKFSVYDNIEEYDETGRVININRRRKSNEDILEQIRRLSCKYYEFIKNEIIHPSFDSYLDENGSEKKRKRCSFIYLDSVFGAGLIYFGLLLKLFGYEKYDKPSVFKRTRQDDGSFTENIEDFPKKKRFALVTSKTHHIDSILELMNSEDNVDGDYIQILACSKLARDGINIFNIKAGYLFAPDWHESGMHQALSRFYRADSYLNLQKKYPDEKILVEVFRFASILKEKDIEIIKKNVSLKDIVLEENEDVEDDEELKKAKKYISKLGINSTVDIDRYLLAEEKNIYEKKKINMMKAIAFDGFLNYDRNVYGDFKDYTKEADYSKKFYRLWSARGEPNNDVRRGIAHNQGPDVFDLEEINNKTYNLYYKTEKIDILINFIIGFIIKFRDNRTIDSLIEYIKNELNIAFVGPKNIILIAFEIIENKKKFIRDRFGNKQYIHLAGESIYLTSISDNIGNNFVHGNSLEYFIKNENLFETKTGVKDEKIKDVIKNLSSLPSNEIFNYLKGEDLDNTERLEIFETSFSMFYVTKNKNLLKIINQFYYYLYMYKTPEALIEYTNSKILEANIGFKGKPRNENSYAGLKNIFNEYDKMGCPVSGICYEGDNFEDLTLEKIFFPSRKISKEEVEEIDYVHFFEDGKQVNSYNVTSVFSRKDKKIRIFNKEKLIFVDTKISENKVYNWLILRIYAWRMRDYSDKIYSKILYSKDDNFRLYNFDEKTKGLTCRSSKLDELKKIILMFCKQNFVEDPLELEELSKISKNDDENRKKLGDYYSYDQHYLDKLDDFEIRICLFIENSINLKKNNKDNTCDFFFKLMKKYNKVIEII
jgi:hypothetical protein